MKVERMLKMKNKDLEVLAHLRQNSRISLTSLSKKSGVPVSTLFDKLKSATPFIKKFTVLVNFLPLGFGTRAMIVVKVKKSSREEAISFLTAHKQVNSAFKVNNGFDYILDVVFRDMKSLEEFIEALEEKKLIEKYYVYYILDTLKQEEFLSSPDAAKWMFPPEKEA